MDPDQEEDGELASIREVDESLSGSQTRYSEEDESPSQPERQPSYSGSQSQEKEHLTVSNLLISSCLPLLPLLHSTLSLLT